MLVTRVSVLGIAILLTAIALGSAAFHANRPSYAKPLIAPAAFLAETGTAAGNPE